MKIMNEDGDMDFEFTSALTKLLGVKEDDVADIIEKLSVDELTDLVDACVNGDAQAAKEIIGSETESEDELNASDDEHDGMFNHMLSKNKIKKIDKSTKDRILKKSKEIEIGEEVDPAVTFNIGDTVSVNGEEATIKIPSAPRDTIGVMINGELKMVDKKNVRTLEEAVLGMTAMPGLKPNNDLQRIRELAGMRDEDSFDAPEPAEFPNQPPMTPPMSDMHDMDDGMNDDAMGMDGDDMGMDHTSSIEMPDMIDHHDDVPMVSPVTTLPSMASMDTGLEDAVALDNAISDIEGLIPNVKISEYKTLVARLKALVSMAENAGKAALTEGRKVLGESVKLTYHKMLGSHNVNKNGSFHRSFPTEYDAEQYVKKNQGKSHEELAKIDEDVELEKVKDYKSMSRDEKMQYHRREMNAADGKFPAAYQHHKDQLARFKNRKTVEDKITPKSVPALSPKVEQPASMDKSTDVTRKTLMDYVRENDEMETIGANRNDALKSFQAKMGAGSTPQKANQAFDAAVAAGTVQQKNGKFQMTPMSDTDFDKSVVKPATAAKPVNQNTQRSTSSNNQPEQTSNAEPGQSAGRQPIQPRK